ncbi:hypothetical protein PHMEG_00017448 [Phytophthora megakarya]|uniref:Uncharacterized protein n=1 Tax=Phytophthora megakarya TaxID=4795 RepID=A0A225VWT3_9STRA|nr:hypothetical protein PHMEG_00017448 [Phytophthora megakarya]
MSDSDESQRGSNAGGTPYGSYAASDSSSDESTRELGPDDFFSNQLTTTLNAGLAAHASVLHEELDVLWDRAREGYNIGLDAVDRLSRDVETRDQTLRELRDENVGLRAHAARATEWKTQYDNLCQTTADEAAAYQDAQTQAEARISNLNSRIAALTSSLPSIPASLTPVASPPPVSEVTTQTDITSVLSNSSSVSCRTR